MYKRVEAGPPHFPQKPILFPSNRYHTYVKGLENRAPGGLQGMEPFSLKKAVKSPTRGNLSESLGDWERGTARGCRLAIREMGGHCLELHSHGSQALRSQQCTQEMLGIVRV